MSHTHGPWALHTPKTNMGFQVIGQNVVVAAIPRLFDEPWAEANAKLIVAAPEMLAELKACEAHLHAYVEAMEYGGGSASKSAERLANIRAAIAKAEGESK